MPVYDRKCADCGAEKIDSFEPVVPPAPILCETCGGSTVRVWITKAPTAIGDACDIYLKHGMCQANGEPQRYTSKSDIRREEQKRGLRNRVEHIGRPGSDKSKHTSRWI